MQLELEARLPQDLSERELQAIRLAVFGDFSSSSLSDWLLENWSTRQCEFIVKNLNKSLKCPPPS
jgi:hypothetical protein